MTQLATITSKRQLTIPAQVFRQAGLRQGQKVLVWQDGKELRIKPAQQAVDRLAGSVRVPARFRNLTTDEIIAQAKNQYFAQ